MISYPLLNNIETDYSGYKALCSFYHFCLKYHNQQINIDFSDLQWIDSNMCSLFFAMIFSLKKSNNLTFCSDFNLIKQKFDVLFRNGFLNEGTPVIDDRKSTVQVRSFDLNSKDEFCHYIDNELLTHRGMPPMSNVLKQQIGEDLLEIFCNAHFHAGTNEPVFVGGQFYPKSGILKFTMVDLGVGFLPRIKKATNGSITSNLDAIKWALQGNSSKMSIDNTPGGLGIRSMYKYSKENNGQLQIISGNGFWSSDYKNTIFEEGREVKNPFVGTTVNLFFSNK